MSTHKKICIPVILLILLVLGSCKSSSELIYLKNMPEGLKSDKLPDSVTEHLVKSGDVLYIALNRLIRN